MLVDLHERRACARSRPTRSGRRVGRGRGGRRRRLRPRRARRQPADGARRARAVRREHARTSRRSDWRDPKASTRSATWASPRRGARRVAPLFTRGIDLFDTTTSTCAGTCSRELLGASRAAPLDNPVAAHTVRLAVGRLRHGDDDARARRGAARARARADTSARCSASPNAARPRRWARAGATRTRAATRSARRSRRLRRRRRDQLRAARGAGARAARDPRRGAAAAIRAGRRLAAADIARAFEPSPHMLIGEPYVHGYQEHIDAEIRETFSSDEGFAVEFFEPVSDRAEMWFCHAPVAPTPEFELDAGRGARRRAADVRALDGRGRGPRGVARVSRAAARAALFLSLSRHAYPQTNPAFPTAHSRPLVTE